MKSLIVLIISLLRLQYLQTAPTLEENDSKKIKALTKLGEEYVEQEVKHALLGMKQMKTIMETNEEKHMDILKSLRNTKEEKLEALKLFDDINERLNIAETECSELLRNDWDVCKDCLQRPCITLYTTTCSQQGFQSFAPIAQEIFKNWTPFSLFLLNDEMNDKSKDSDKEVAQHTQTDKPFNAMMSDEGIQIFKNAYQVFDQSFRNIFKTDVMLTNDGESTAEPHKDPQESSEIFSHWNISDLIQSFCDFSRAVFEGITDVVIKMFNDYTHESKEPSVPAGSLSYVGDRKSETNATTCKELQNSTECLKFQERCQLCYATFIKDCPDVLVLYLKSVVAYKLVNISAQQYEDLMLIVQQHTEETADIMTQMKERFGWVTHETDHFFSIDKVSYIYNSMTDPATVNETIIEVNVLSSPKFSIRVPGNIDLESPEFMKYVAEKALSLYKQNF